MNKYLRAAFAGFLAVFCAFVIGGYAQAGEGETAIDLKVREIPRKNE